MSIRTAGRITVRCDGPNCSACLTSVEYVFLAEKVGWFITLDRKRHYCCECAVRMSRQVGVS